MKHAFALFLLISAIAAAQTAQQPATPAKSPDKPNEEVLLSADRAFNDDTATRRLEGWMAYMADDAVLFSSKPMVGKDAIRAYFQTAFADPAYSLSWQPTRGEMFRSGNMGYTTGRFEQRRKDDKGNNVVNHGNYLTVWQKQPDGSWKVKADGGSPDTR
jgi:ketosteroid isomerase-like protein